MGDRHQHLKIRRLQSCWCEAEILPVLTLVYELPLPAGF